MWTCEACEESTREGGQTDEGAVKLPDFGRSHLVIDVPVPGLLDRWEKKVAVQKVERIKKHRPPSWPSFVDARRDLWWS